MSRQRSRKRERAAARRRDRSDSWSPGTSEPTDEDILALVAEIEAPSRALARACGNCREYVDDENGGRGSCLHPGSGIFGPWTDTPACAFFTARRSRPERPW